MIPDDWEERTLQNCARGIVRGASPRPIDDPKWFDDRSPVGWLRISDVTSAGRFLTTTTQRLSDAGIRHSRKVPAGSLVMSICATVGRPIETRIDVCIHDGFVLFDKPDVEQDFLYHVLTDLEPRWTKKGQTGSQMNLNTGLIKGTKIAVPKDGVEQSAIATTLSDVDALLAAQEALIAKKRAIKQGAMQELLTGKRRLPGFDGEWEVRRLGDHLEFLSNGVNSRAELMGEGRVRYLHYGDIHGTDCVLLNPATAAMPCLPEAKARRLDRLRDGDLVFADASEDLYGVGKSVELQGVGEIEVVSGMHTIAVRFDKAILADGFKGYLQFVPSFQDHLHRLASGTKVLATNMSHIASAEVKLPSAKEQVAITEVLADMGAEVSALEAQRSKTAQLKQGMMQALLTGRIRLV
ncbi:MAG: restriction endonuclease subunit S [Pseudoxanthomonas sp.]|nr:restriction endonuclease subunit S [Pseudoxanthomonas sp.]